MLKAMLKPIMIVIISDPCVPGSMACLTYWSELPSYTVKTSRAVQLCIL